MSTETVPHTTGAPRATEPCTSATTPAPAPAPAPDAARPDPARPDPEAGLATAEYAIATIAAVGFAGLLVLVLKSGSVRKLLEGIIETALSV